MGVLSRRRVRAGRARRSCAHAAAPLAALLACVAALACGEASGAGTDVRAPGGDRADDGARATGAARSAGTRPSEARVDGCPARMAPVDARTCVDRREAAIGPDGAAVPAEATPPARAVSFDAAQRACARAGYRLCRRDEWTRACRGDAGRTFPYGETYEPGRCNTAEHDTDLARVAPLPSGSRAGCVTPEGVFDLSGNVWEWTDAADDTGALRELRGGGAWTGESEARCEGEDRRFQPPGEAFDGYGFRCCADRAPAADAPAAPQAPSPPDAPGPPEPAASPRAS